MTTANLQILDEYKVDANDYADFREHLAAWAGQWVPEIALPIAKASRELFENRAVRMFVAAWAKADEADREMFKVAFEHAEDGDDVQPDDFHGLYHHDKGAYSQALYLLLVK